VKILESKERVCACRPGVREWEDWQVRERAYAHKPRGQQGGGLANMNHEPGT